MIAMSCAKCRPIQFFLNFAPPLLSPAPTLHLLSTHEPESQSASFSQAGAASHVPSLHIRPSLHSIELSQATPQSLLPRTEPPQPGKFGGHSSLATQRVGACSPG